MSKEQSTPPKGREQTNQLIKELIMERAQVWNLYCCIAGVESYQSDRPVEELIQEFCQLMVDYISLGHFGIYQRIIDGSERRQSVIEAAEHLYPQITQVTDAALSFNQKYQTLSSVMVLNQLIEDLSVLGEHLATRIQLEDELIGIMMS